MIFRSASVVGDISADVLVRSDILVSREQMRRSETRYRRLYEAAKDGILILDAGSARITDANPFIAELLGYAQANLVGKELWQIGFFKDIDENKAAMRTLQETHYIRYEDLPLKTTDGRLIDVEFVSNVYTEGAQQVIQCNVRDITERKRLEDRARRYADELQESDRHKNEFLAMLGHELRNPLAPIRNALHIMRLTAGDSPAVQSVAQMMERQVAQMVRLVDDLLDVSRVSRGTIELRKETVDLASIINNAVEASRPMCESMGHRLAVTLPPQPVWLDADPSRLVQVVGNLLNNACKFTERGGRIGLSVAQEDGQAVIRVRDSGVGIGADQLPQVFDLFMQVDRSLGRSVSGLGLGLTLVKSLVEIHGGTVQAHSAGLGQGSEFVVRLPMLATVTKAPPKPVAAEPAGQRAQRVLVVDDNQDAAQSLATLLQLSGFETTTVYDGLDAVAAAHEFRPDVALLDIGLPSLNGFEVAAKLRQQPGGAAMVLVALTGWGQEQDRRKSSEAGFDHHMVKPVDIDDLMKLLADLPLAVLAR